MTKALHELGWQSFPHDPELARWVDGALPHALAAVADPDNARWLRCDGTWFAGVNALPNAADGSIGASGPLRGIAVDAARDLIGQDRRWDKAQVSAIYPGYPRQENENDTAFGYRLRRDAAHVDGLARAGRENRRFIREPHGFVLGIPLTNTTIEASPLVVWEGSHRIMRAAFLAALAGQEPENWTRVDVTDAYVAARRHCFETCRRVAVHARPGEAYLIHRLALHGVIPWGPNAKAAPAGRVIAYFRPLLESVDDWLAD